MGKKDGRYRDKNEELMEEVGELFLTAKKIVMKKYDPKVQSLFRKIFKVGLFSRLNFRGKVRRTNLLLKFLIKLDKSTLLMPFPKKLAKFLSRSELKLVLMIFLKKRDDWLFFERKRITEIEMARVRANKSDLYDSFISCEARELANVKLSEYRTKLSDNNRAIKRSFANSELNKYKMNINSARIIARDLW